MLEIKLRLPSRTGGVSIRFSTRDGSEPHPVVTLDLVSDRMAKRLIHLPQAPDEVTLCPCRAPGELEIRHLRMIRVGEKFALDRMLGKIGRMHPAFRELPKAEILSALTTPAGQPSGSPLEAVYAQYCRLFENICTFPGSYGEWLAAVERARPRNPEDAAAFGGGCPAQPRFFVLIEPRGKATEAALRTVQSVLDQSYGKWDIFPAPGAPLERPFRELLQGLGQKDPRVRLLAPPDAAEAPRQEGGDFFVLLEVGDILAPHALSRIARHAIDNPAARVIYSDHDVIDASGFRTDPHFKSGWNPDLFYSDNYLLHVCAVDAALFRSVDGVRPASGRGGYLDVLLRCLDGLQESAVAHLPEILCHRIRREEPAMPDALEASENLGALRAYFSSRPSAPEVDQGPAPGLYRIRWPVPVPAPRVTLVIPTRDHRDMLETCVSSILGKTQYENFEILIVDNQSREPSTLEYFGSLSKHSRVRVLRYEKEFNYSDMNNFAVSRTDAEIVGLVNNDVEVIGEEWLSEMVSLAVRKDIGCVGAKLYYPDETIQHAGVICSLGGVAGHSHRHFPRNHPGYCHRLQVTQNLSAVTGACLLVRRCVYEEVGGLDARNLAVALNDVDFCLRVREAGYRNVWTPYAELYHHESVTRGLDDTPEKSRRLQKEIDYMKRRWPGALQCDPYYNPNLTKAREDFSLGLP
jgi:GT2 family glycosyltransferase